jgi:Tol biopolymer transport system component
VSQTSIAYETPDLKIIQADLTNGNTNVMVTYHSGFGSGQYSISSDGKSVTYIDGNAWHLAGPSGDKVLTTLPPVPARGVGPDEDDSYLSFSPDGKYIALFQTFHTGGTGETAPDQIRRATDGGLVYSTSGMTMAVWASVPSRLYFRDGNSAAMHRWDATSGVSNMTAIKWIRPRSSPDGRWIAYTFRTTSGLGGVGLYSVQANSISNTTPPGRSGVKFLTNDLVWYVGERACSNCIGPELTGQTYIYSIAGASEVTARLSAVYDAWPHFTAPGVG